MKASKLTLANFLLLGLLSAQNVWAATAPTDPYTQPATDRPGYAKKYINLRIINHGVAIDPAGWTRQLNGIERVYSQCNGIDFRVKIMSDQSVSLTTLADHLIDPRAGQQYLTQSFLDFFTPWISSRPVAPEQNVIDVHIVDYESEYDRQNYANNPTGANGGYFGQAFNLMKLDRDFVYEPTISNPPKASSVAGNTVVLAMLTLQKSEANNIADAIQHSTDAHRDSTLLAHEIGHLLMNYDLLDANGNYMSHACPGVNTYCPPANFLSAGGATENVSYQNQQVSAYSPLAQIEQQQCAILESNSWVYDEAP